MQNKTNTGRAQKIAQALLSGDSASAQSLGDEYVRDAMDDALNDFSGWGDEQAKDVASDFFDNALENLDVETMGALAKLVPDDAWNEDEMEQLLASFLDILKAEREQTIDEFAHDMADGQMQARDPNAYYGVKDSDFF